MKNDEVLQKDVQDAIKWEPLLNVSDIGVTSIDSVITLTGIVDSYLKKSKAEDTAKAVAGVKAIVEKIEVKFINPEDRTDNEIALEVLSALKANWQIPYKRIKVKVEDGWVTLNGDVEWNYQKDAVKTSVRNLDGVKVLTNDIRVQPQSSDEIEIGDIERALQLNWSTEDQDINVSISNNNVTLNGTVNSYYQKDEAEKIAWNAPGVWTVKNELVIDLKD